MSNSLLFGYYAISKRNLWDYGNDPYFHSKPFSWGICRPNNRTFVERDTRIFFYTFKDGVRIGDYFLTGMMKVEKIYDQIQAANSELYCGKDKITCPYKLNKSYKKYSCRTSCNPKLDEEYLKSTIIKRDCRCNIVVDPKGKYKKYCDGDRHEHIFKKYLHSLIYFVSIIEHSVATKKKIRVLDFLSKETSFWNYAKFYGYELSEKIADQFENELRKNEYREK